MLKTITCESDFEKINVQDVYNKISKHFDQTRYHTWPKIKEFTNKFNKNSMIGDIGCGNGRNCNLRDDCIYHGYDNCEGFVNLCKEKNITCKKSSILNIDCSNNVYDYCMCIAVIHHLSTEERRIKAIQELIRITKKGGKILIYVWAKEQKKFKMYDEKDIMVPWNLQKKYSQNETNLYYRYYHLFEKRELENLIENCGLNIVIEENGYQADNYYAIIKVI
tara:strand:+ start:4215 stop:4877 length:663 start_codon:yes stop_codon:yes gene_type:complete